MNSYTPLSLEAERLLKIASNLDDNLKAMPIKVIRDSRGNDWLIDVSPDDTAKYIALKQLVKDTFNNAENAFKAAEADLKQRNAGRCILSETPPIDGTVTYDYETGIVTITT